MPVMNQVNPFYIHFVLHNNVTNLIQFHFHKHIITTQYSVCESVNVLSWLRYFDT
jgi:hypothetical protein